MAQVELTDEQRIMMLHMITEAHIPGGMIEEFVLIKQKLREGLALPPTFQFNGSTLPPRSTR